MTRTIVSFFIALRLEHNLSSKDTVHASRPLQSHSRLASQLQIVPKAPCFVEKTSAKTILNCFHPRSPAGGANILITRTHYFISVNGVLGLVIIRSQFTSSCFLLIVRQNRKNPLSELKKVDFFFIGFVMQHYYYFYVFQGLHLKYHQDSFLVLSFLWQSDKENRSQGIKIITSKAPSKMNILFAIILLLFLKKY